MTGERPITLSPPPSAAAGEGGETVIRYDDQDIDFVDDALLNTAPHNSIERQLLTGDVVGLALMSSAIIWSAMGAFG
jgi:hypothetical protein